MAQSRTSLRSSGKVVTQPRPTHYLFRRDKKGKVQHTAVWQGFSEEEAIKAQDKFEFPTMIVSWDTSALDKSRR
jgi:hypothetical protein